MIKDDLDNQKHTIEVSKTKKRKTNKTQTVKIIDFDMPFGSILSLLIKWSIASIPALMILFVIFFLMGIIFIPIFSSFLLNIISHT